MILTHFTVFIEGFLFTQFESFSLFRKQFMIALGGHFGCQDVPCHRLEYILILLCFVRQITVSVCGFVFRSVHAWLRRIHISLTA